MASYRYLVLRASDGEPLGELPAAGVGFSEVLTGDGSFECSLPFSHPSAGSLIDPGLGREIAVIRTDAPGSAPTCEFAGPIVQVRRELGPQGGAVTVAARSPLWYLSRRVTEGARNYGRTVLGCVDDLVQTATATGARAGIKPSAGLYRFSVTPTTGGPVKRWTIGGADRTPILDVIQDLADDDAAGFDYRMRYPYVATGLQVSRVLELGYPTLGVDRTDRTFELGAGLITLTDDVDVDRAANRVHVLGAGTGKGARRAVAVNGPHLQTSGILLEAVVDRTNVATQATLNGMAGAYRRQFAPPTRVLALSYRPTPALPYGFCDLGDTVRIRVVSGSEVVDLKRRVVARTTRVDDAGVETVEVVLNNPLDEVVS